MSSCQWPSTGRYRPKVIADHSASLQADFDNVYNTAQDNLSGASELTSKLLDKVATGITKGVVEAQMNGHYFKWEDKDSFVRTILSNVTTEAAAGTRDTIPLAQFYGLRESYQELHAKLKAPWPRNAAYGRLDRSEEEAVLDSALFNGTRIVEIKSYSATITLEIVHQASVNQMEGKDSRHLGEAISVSLEAFFSVDWFKGSVRLSAARLLDSGDVEVVAHAEHQEDLERLLESTAWHEEFERSLGVLPSKTYNVRMHNMRIGCMVFRDRKEKSTIIKTLADINFPVDSNGSNGSIIRNIYWTIKGSAKKKVEKTTALTVEFSSPEQANKALANGLFWQGTRHACNIADRQQYPLQRCLTCQDYGHLSQTCSAEPRCGDCAGPHRTDICTSTKSECALCGGAHYSSSYRCPARQRAKKIHGFPTTFSPPAAEPVAEVQVTIKTEPDEQGTMFDRTKYGNPIPGTLLQQTEGFRIVGMARDTDSRSHASVRPKRKAEEPLPEPESDSGEDIKRIKQEYIKQEESPHREDSMAPYRQPSPYIVHRPD